MYKRVPHRPYKDPTTTADVWPSVSAFDAFALIPSSPLTIRTSARPRSMPGQAEEEAHQLAFVAKHVLALLSLLADPASSSDGEAAPAEELLSGDKFERLNLLLRAGSLGTELAPLSQATPFFANADPAMPAAPLPVSAVAEWLLRHICGASEHVRDSPDAGGPARPPGPATTAALGEAADVTMAEVGSNGGGGSSRSFGSAGSGSVSSQDSLLSLGSGSGGGIGGGGGSSSPQQGGSPRAAAAANGVAPWPGQAREWWPEGMTCVDGIAKMSVLKGESDIEGGTVRVSHCHDSVVYILSPLRYASVIGCSDSIVVLGAVSKAVKVEHCERVQVIVPCSRVCIASCRECVFYLGTNQRPLFLGDNHNLQVAPYNTFYPRLDAHLAQAGVDPSVNRWDEPITLGQVDPHDAMSHPAGVGDAPAEGATILQPDRFVPFVIPFRTGVASSDSAAQQQLTRANPFLLPKTYLTALQHKTKTVEGLRQTLKTAVLEESKKRELTNVIQAHFKEWLFSSGNIRQVYDLARLDRDPG
eukprot:SM000029S10504  [mRNA]  locus=s29:521449:524493:+ [translate_table: standard]